ncbi:recombinase family protein [Pseudomonas aeruginosa]|uniref:recombinase family protein n=1 Tax=Pseudomonas aeruginosa TaxID=287 RepID=UPI004038E302
MALIGYARVSTEEQDTALQTDALRKAGCERVFEDTASGAKSDRPGFADALAYLRDGHGRAAFAMALRWCSIPLAREMTTALAVAAACLLPPDESLLIHVHTA